MSAPATCTASPAATGSARTWTQRWEWASTEGRHPVLIEEFQPPAASIYSEHHVTDTSVTAAETGILLYAGRRLSHQIVPLAHVEDVPGGAGGGPPPRGRPPGTGAACRPTQS